MPKPELVDSSAHKSTYTRPILEHILIGTWTVSRGEPHLFYWRDHNSYDDDPYILHSIEPGHDLNAVARATVVDCLRFEGINDKQAQRAIKAVQRHGTTIVPILEEGTEGMEWKRRKITVVFVEVMPSALNTLTKQDHHLLLPASVLRARREWDNSLERRIKIAFKDFAAQKQPTGKN